MLDLYDAPGDTIALTLGTRLFGDQWDTGLRVRDVNARGVATGLAPGNRMMVETQPGHELLDLFLGFRPSRDVENRVALENATNEGYFLTDGFGGAQGSPVPGRNLRFSVWVKSEIHPDWGRAQRLEANSTLSDPIPKEHISGPGFSSPNPVDRSTTSMLSVLAHTRVGARPHPVQWR